MEVQILGFEKVDYTKKDGTHVSGYNINYGSSIDSKYGEGLRVSREYISSSRIKGVLRVNCVAIVTYGRGYDDKAYLSGLECID